MRTGPLTYTLSDAARPIASRAVGRQLRLERGLEHEMIKQVRTAA